MSRWVSSRSGSKGLWENLSQFLVAVDETRAREAAGVGWCWSWGFGAPSGLAMAGRAHCWGGLSVQRVVVCKQSFKMDKNHCRPPALLLRLPAVTPASLGLYEACGRGVDDFRGGCV